MKLRVTRTSSLTGEPLKPMCNCYGCWAPISRLIDEFSQTRIPLVFSDDAVPDLEPRSADDFLKGPLR